MRLEYIAPTKLPYHFLGFSGFDKEEHITREDWVTTVNKVTQDIFPLVHLKAKELGSRVCCISCPSICNIMYTNECNEIGIRILKLPPKSNNLTEKLYRKNMNTLNTFIFDSLSNISDGADVDIYLEQCKIGTMDNTKHFRSLDKLNLKLDSLAEEPS